MAPLGMGASGGSAWGRAAGSGVAGADVAGTAGHGECWYGLRSLEAESCLSCLLRLPLRRGLRCAR
jgi:hypothetical protein